MDPYERFHQLLRRDLSPLLRADGFKGSGTTFRRLTGDRIDAVNIQGSRYGGSCCVNTAVHFFFLPTASGGSVDTKRIKEYECAFRTRLHEQSADHWWTYGESGGQAEAGIARLVEMYNRRGRAFFGQFEPFPDAFESITPAQLEAGDFSKMPGQMTIVLASLTMARILDHLGRRTRRQEFAEVGLRHLGGAARLKPELERLRSTDRGPT